MRVEQAQKTVTANDDGTQKILDSDAREDLYQAVASLRTADECRNFLADLCTPREIDDFAERWVIARLLAAGGHSYRDISAATGASTTTVGRVARFLQQERNDGYKLVLDRQKRVLTDGKNSKS